MACPACPGHCEEQSAEIQEMSNSLQSHSASILFTLLSYSLYPWTEIQTQEKKSPAHKSLQFGL